MNPLLISCLSFVICFMIGSGFGSWVYNQPSCKRRRARVITFFAFILIPFLVGVLMQSLLGSKTAESPTIQNVEKP